MRQVIDILTRLLNYERGRISFKGSNSFLRKENKKNWFKALRDNIGDYKTAGPKPPASVHFDLSKSLHA